MSEKQTPESPEVKGTKKTGLEAGKGTPEIAPPDSEGTEPARKSNKPKSNPPKKPGPSVIIAPGPGSDVIATPPRRI